MNHLTISFIIPAYNEGNNLTRILEAINYELFHLHYGYKIFFIDDGSTDKTLELVQALAFDHPRS